MNYDNEIKDNENHIIYIHNLINRIIENIEYNER